MTSGDLLHRSAMVSFSVPSLLHLPLRSSGLDFFSNCHRWHLLLTRFTLSTAKFSRKEEGCYAQYHFCIWTCSYSALTGKKGSLSFCFGYKLRKPPSRKDLLHTLSLVFLCCICILSLKSCLLFGFTCCTISSIEYNSLWKRFCRIYWLLSLSLGKILDYLQETKSTFSRQSWM